MGTIKIKPQIEEETPHRPSALWFGLPACTHC
ncbi:ORFL180W [Human betaherpesvirus 5]|nr:ORFL180W [Human betaherpesvirus 5]QHX40523.1 ORFL180W [Human betaherpesvirus 5]